jgi:hypothetical protein
MARAIKVAIDRQLQIPLQLKLDQDEQASQLEKRCSPRRPVSYLTFSVIIS